MAALPHSLQLIISCLFGAIRCGRNECGDFANLFELSRVVKPYVQCHLAFFLPFMSLPMAIGANKTE